MMVAKKASVPADSFTEYGASGLKQFSGYVREEFQRELIGRKGVLTLREMRDNDPIIGAIFFALEMLLRGVSIRVDPEDKKNQDDIAAADFIESCFGDMEVSWSSLLADILTFLQFGWDVHEIVYKIRGGDKDDPKFKSKYTDSMIGWRKFAPRAQETLLHWIFNESGDAIALVQLLPTGGPLLTVPLSKCVHFRTTPSKQNPEGRSLLRNIYVPYYYKKVIQEIEAIGVSRDLTGLTVVRVPAKWTLKTASPDDKAALAQAKVLARDIARNQQEGLVIPVVRNDKDPKELDFDITLLSTGGRRQFATNDILSRYNHEMAAAVLADFITLGTGGQRSQGTGAQSKNKTDIFSVAVVAFLDLICSAFNEKAIPDLLKLNGMNGTATLAHGDIQRRDLQEFGTYLLDAFQAGVLTPDDNLEAHVREEGGLPEMDAASARPTAADERQSQIDATASATANAQNGTGGQNPGGGGKAPAAGGKEPRAASMKRIMKRRLLS